MKNFDHHTKQRQAEIRQFGKRVGLAAGVIWWGLGGIFALAFCAICAALS